MAGPACPLWLRRTERSCQTNSESSATARLPCFLGRLSSALFRHFEARLRPECPLKGPGPSPACAVAREYAIHPSGFSVSGRPQAGARTRTLPPLDRQEFAPLLVEVGNGFPVRRSPRGRERRRNAAWVRWEGTHGPAPVIKSGAALFRYCRLWVLTVIGVPQIVQSRPRVVLRSKGV